MRRVFAVLAVVLAVVVLLAVVADRVALFVTERAVADRLGHEPGVTAAPDVSIAGFPFLTQVAGGQYDRVDVRFRDLDVAGRLRLSGLVATADGLHASVGDVLGARLSQIRADAVDATATASFAQLDALLATRTPQGVRVRSGPGSRPDELVLRVSALGRTASGRVRLAVVAGRPRVAVVPGSFSGLPASVSDQVVQVLRAGLAVPALPFGLAVTGLRTGAGGLEVEAGGRRVALAG